MLEAAEGSQVVHQRHLFRVNVFFSSEWNKLLGLTWETLTLHVTVNVMCLCHLVVVPHTACHNKDDIKLEKKQLGRKSLLIFLCHIRIN